MRLKLLFRVITVFCAALATNAHAQSYASGTLKLVRTGWNADSFAVVLNAPQQNPANCPNGNNPNAGYVSDGSLPGYKTYYQAALAAYAVKGVVTVAIDNGACVGGWPKIIGIDLPR